jgi:hypothetical protein
VTADDLLGRTFTARLYGAGLTINIEMTVIVVDAQQNRIRLHSELGHRIWMPLDDFHYWVQVGQMTPSATRPFIKERSDKWQGNLELKRRKRGQHNAISRAE